MYLTTPRCMHYYNINMVYNITTVTFRFLPAATGYTAETMYYTYVFSYRGCGTHVRGRPAAAHT